MYTMSKVHKWRRVLVRLMLAIVVVSIALWISTKKPREIILIERENIHERIKLVPRGQTFYHSYPESNRYTSDDTWRPHEFYKANQMLVNRKHTTSHFHQELPRDEIEGADKILLLMKTSMQTIWKQMPIHLFTTLTQFPNAILYSDGPDSVGGIEVVDILSYIDKQQLQTAKQLLYYRIHRSLRDKHVYIAPDQVHVAGGEHVDKFKHLHMLLHAWNQQKAQKIAKNVENLSGYILQEGTRDFLDNDEEDDFDWYVIIDDDSFVFGHSMIEFLNGLDATKPYYLGSSLPGPNHIYADGGSGIILSKAAMQNAFEHANVYDWVEEYTRLAEDEDHGDYVLARYLKEKFEIGLDEKTSDYHFQGDPAWRVHFDTNNWCKEVFSFAKQAPRDIELLWEYQRVKQSKLLYIDLYLDFVKPYIPENAQKNWDNGANSAEYSPQGDYQKDAPYASYDNCRLACESDPSCLMYRHDAYRHYCGLGIDTISLGRPTIRYQESTSSQLCKTYGIMCRERAEGEEMTSGWILRRIKKIRRQMSCDPLYDNPFNEGEEGNALDQTEGWWLRAKERYGTGARDPLL